MARPRDPKALKDLRGRSHMTKDEKAEADREVYASAGEIKAPDHLKGKAQRAMFEKAAAYMRRVNAACPGHPVYGDTDIEALAVMVMAHFSYLEYRELEAKEKDIELRQKYNTMKNKEAATEDRYLKMLKLDPGNRVSFGGAGGGAGGEENPF